MQYLFVVAMLDCENYLSKEVHDFSLNELFKILTMLQASSHGFLSFLILILDNISECSRIYSFSHYANTTFFVPEHLMKLKNIRIGQSINQRFFFIQRVPLITR